MRSSSATSGSPTWWRTPSPAVVAARTPRCSPTWRRTSATGPGPSWCWSASGRPPAAPPASAAATSPTADPQDFPRQPLFLLTGGRPYGRRHGRLRGGAQGQDGRAHLRGGRLPTGGSDDDLLR